MSRSIALAVTLALLLACASKGPSTTSSTPPARQPAPLAAGNLTTNEQQVVTQEQGIIRIRSADPNVIYVPIYDPIVIYVASPTPIVSYYPPYPCYWCPSAAFGMGMMMGFDWYYHDIYYEDDYDGVSGVMTFVVNQQGKVFQKGLGPKSSAIAEAMTRYDPDASWTEVTE